MPQTPLSLYYENLDLDLDSHSRTSYQRGEASASRWNSLSGPIFSPRFPYIVCYFFPKISLKIAKNSP